MNIDSDGATINIFGNNSKANINSSGNCRNIKVNIYANNTRVCSQGEVAAIECYGVGSMISCYGEKALSGLKKVIGLLWRRVMSFMKLSQIKL